MSTKKCVVNARSAFQDFISSTSQKYVVSREGTPPCSPPLGPSSIHVFRIGIGAQFGDPFQNWAVVIIVSVSSMSGWKQLQPRKPGMLAVGDHHEPSIFWNDGQQEIPKKPPTPRCLVLPPLLGLRWQNFAGYRFTYIYIYIQYIYIYIYIRIPFGFGWTNLLKRKHKSMAICSFVSQRIAGSKSSCKANCWEINLELLICNPFQ